jgi:hypothetical protein
MGSVDGGGTNVQASGEQFTDVGGLRLCYQTFGDPGDDADVREVTRRSQQGETGNGSGRRLAPAVGERDRTAGPRRMADGARNDG